MKYTYPIEEYRKRLLEYVELEKLSFSPEDSRGYVLEKLEERSKKKRVIADVANTMIREYLETFEKEPDKITPGDADVLYKFLKLLVPEGLYTGQATDFGVLYRLAKILTAYYKNKDIDRYSVALNRCSYGYRAYIQSHSLKLQDSPYIDDCLELVTHMDELTDEEKTTALYALSRCVVMNIERFPLEFYRTVNDIILSNLKKPYSDREELMLLIMYGSILDGFSDYCLYARDNGTEADVSLYRPFLKGICDHVRECIDEDRTCGLGNLKLERVLMITDFHFGAITLDELLDGLTEIQNEAVKSESTGMQGFGLGTVNYLYLTYLYKYSPKPKEEIVRLSRERIYEVMPKLLPLSRKVNNPQFGRFLVTFLNAASLTGNFGDFEDVILEATVYADRALFIHTVMVREMSRAIFDHMIEKTPEAFDGTAGHDTEYIRTHKDEMKKLLEDCCMYHDIGKFFMLDIVENSMRRLSDDEFLLIKGHPKGFDGIYSMNDEHDERVVCIRDCALTHHLWHDGSRGYPDIKQTKNRPFADILAIADSIDAATDFLGRPYNSGKTIDQLIAEFQAGAGTHYGPEAAAALSAPEVRDRLHYLITEGRRDIYYRIYAFNKL